LIESEEPRDEMFGGAISAKTFPSTHHPRIDPTAMAANYQDQIILFGDSLTQWSWDSDNGGIGARLSSTSVPTVTFQMIAQRRRFVCAQTRHSKPRFLRVQYGLGTAGVGAGTSTRH